MKIEHTKSLAEAFQYRGLTRHAKPHYLERHAGNDHSFYLVLDPALSKKILTSRSFSAFNYFKPGFERFSNKGQPLTWIEGYFDANLLFKDGKKHQVDKKTVYRLLETMERDLKAFQPTIERYFQKRRQHIRSAIDFAQALTRICFGLLISGLLTIPLRRVLRTLSMRQNVWFVYFHPSRQKAMNDALAYLYRGELPPGENEPGYFEHLLAQSLIVMGYDPLVGSICASIAEGRLEGFAADSFRYCPTSFVSRLCRQTVVIDDIEFAPGDVCFTSLLPASDQHEANTSSLAYGAGPHACVGKSLSLLILAMAQDVYHHAFPEGFEIASTLAPNGAFLDFKKDQQALS